MVGLAQVSLFYRVIRGFNKFAAEARHSAKKLDAVREMRYKQMCVWGNTTTHADVGSNPVVSLACNLFRVIPLARSGEGQEIVEVFEESRHLLLQLFRKHV